MLQVSGQQASDTQGLRVGREYEDLLPRAEHDPPHEEHVRAGGHEGPTRDRG